MTGADGATGGWRHPRGQGIAPALPAQKLHRALLALLLSSALPAAAAPVPGRSLADMSFDELADIEITSVSKKAESLGGAAASIFVITADDIRRYGANTLAETLRLAPNLQVARLNAQQYAISARGFNNATGNKLLVLIDGRIVYTPLYSGVFWDAQDVPLEDVERIEVISGPGGTLWGTNAVNGVINIITRAAHDTRGTRLTAGSGNQETALGLRYGESLAPKADYRVYAKVVDRDATERADGQPVRDAWRRAQGGFRADWAQAQDRFTVQGDTYSGDLDQPYALAAVRGTNLLTRWQRTLPQGGGLNLLAYFDRTERDFPGLYRETTDIFNVELLHTLAPLGVHALTWGGSARQGHDHEENSAVLAFLPAHVDQQWLSLFGQDEIAWQDDWRLTLGARIEHNDYTGHEFLPSVRLAWQPTGDRLLWGAVSRVVRAPSRIDRDFYIPAQPPFLLTGNTTFESETALVHELGYRTQATATTSYSVTVFHTDYDDLRTIELAPSGSFVIGNGMEGSSNGIEAWGRWQVTPRWRLSAGFTALDERLRLKPGSINPGGTSSEGNDPEQTLQLRSLLNLSARQELDFTLRHVADLPNPAVPAHTALDAHWGWTLRPGLALAVVGQNLGDRRQPEFGRAGTRSEIPSSFFVSLSWQR